MSYHQYPFRLLFRGGYSKPGRYRRVMKLVRDVVAYPCDLVVMPGYHRVEYWAMLLACMFVGRRRAVFCDSTEFDRPAIPLEGHRKAALLQALRRLLLLWAQKQGLPPEIRSR